MDATNNLINKNQGNVQTFAYICAKTLAAKIFPQFLMSMATMECVVKFNLWGPKK